MQNHATVLLTCTEKILIIFRTNVNFFIVKLLPVRMRDMKPCVTLMYAVVALRPACVVIEYRS